MGLAVARILGQRGFHIVLTYRSSRKPALESVQMLSRESIPASAERCDLAKPASIRSLIRTLQRRFHRLDVIVNLASQYEKSRFDSGGALKDWEENLAANVRGGYLLVSEASALLKASSQARVILISDWTAASGRPRYRDYAPYYISKSAVKSAVEVLALELAPTVLVNAIAPGPMIPPPDLSPAERKAVETATPLGRWGGAEEIAKAVGFLVDSEFVTGETIRVDGGRHVY